MILMFFSVLDLFLQVLPKKYIWHFGATWLISQPFTRRRNFLPEKKHLALLYNVLYVPIRNLQKYENILIQGKQLSV